MKKTLLQILGFALMVLGLQGAIRLLVSGDEGLLSWLQADTSLLVAIYVVVSGAGVYVLSTAQKKTTKS